LNSNKTIPVKSNNTATISALSALYGRKSDMIATGGKGN